MTRQELTNSIFSNLKSPTAIDFHTFTYGKDDVKIARMTTIWFNMLSISNMDKIKNEIYKFCQYGWIVTHDYKRGIGIATSSFDAEFYAGLPLNVHTIIPREKWEEENKSAE